MTSGLKNLGNTCYINSIIQCLNCIYVDLQHHNTDNVLLNKLMTLLKVMNEEACIISPVSFIKAIRSIFPKYNNIEQQDAHEFLLDFLNYIHENETNLSKIEEVNIYAHYIYKERTKAWKECVKHNSFISNKIFGQISRVYRCRDCDHEFTRYERCNSIDILPHTSILESLHRHFNFNDIVYISCENCGKPERNVEHYVTTKLSKTPDYLFINLKKQDKLELDEVLDMAKFSLENAGNISYSYKLISIVCHIGLNPYTGHYYTIDYNNKMCFDDTNVFSVKNFNNEDAYILLYKRIITKSD